MYTLTKAAVTAVLCDCNTVIISIDIKFNFVCIVCCIEIFLDE